MFAAVAFHFVIFFLMYVEFSYVVLQVDYLEGLVEVGDQYDVG